jgi:hypothetical protein
MNIAQFASQPKLVKVELNSVEMLQKYNEPVVFYWYDILPIDIYFEFFATTSESRMENISKVLTKVILDESGKPALKEGEVLPTDIVTEIIYKLSEHLKK